MNARAAIVMSASPIPMSDMDPDHRRQGDCRAALCPETASSTAISAGAADDRATQAAMPAAGTRALASPPRSRASDAIDGVAAERPDDAHVEDVGAQDHEPAVLEDQAPGPR